MGQLSTGSRHASCDGSSRARIAAGGARAFACDCDRPTARQSAGRCPAASRAWRCGAESRAESQLCSAVARRSRCAGSDNRRSGRSRDSWARRARAKARARGRARRERIRSGLGVRRPRLLRREVQTARRQLCRGRAHRRAAAPGRRRHRPVFRFAVARKSPISRADRHPIRIKRTAR